MKDSNSSKKYSSSYSNREHLPDGEVPADERGGRGAVGDGAEHEASPRLAVTRGGGEVLGVGPRLPLQLGEHVVGAAGVLLALHDGVGGPGKTNDDCQTLDKIVGEKDSRFRHLGDPLLHLLLDLVLEVELQQRSGVSQLRRAERRRSSHVGGGGRRRLVVRGREELLLGGCEV